MLVLITAANSAQAHKLKSKLNNDEVILGDYHELPAFMIAQGNMIKIPNPASASYTHEILTLCLDKAIDKLYVLTEQEGSILLLSEQLFNEYGITIQVLNNNEI